MTYRAVPYGYIRNLSGEIEIDTKMTPYIKSIFEKTISGVAMNQIARWLSEERVLRKSGDYNWTHTTIAGILKNSNYIGNDEYPSIISQEEFDQVEELRGGYRNRTYCTLNNKYPLSSKILCGQCGNILHHHIIKEKGIEVSSWRCSKYLVNSRINCMKLVIKDDILIQLSITVCNYIINNWSYLKRSRNNNFKEIQNDKLMSLDLEIRHALNVSTKNEGSIIALLNERTAEAWSHAQVNDFSLTNNLMEEAIKSQTSPIIRFDEVFFKRIVKYITLLSEGRVSFTLLNDVVLNREYPVQERNEDECQEV